MTTPPRPPRSPSSTGRFLRAASGVLFEALKFEDLLEEIIDRVIEATGATKGFVILIGPDGQLDFRLARNMDRSEIENPRNLISRGIIRRAVDAGCTVMTGDAQGDPRFDSLESVQNLLLKSILCVPLRGSAGVVGVLYLENHVAAGVFDKTRRELVERLADDAAIALEMARTVERLKVERDRLAVENTSYRELFQSEYDLGRLIGRSPAMTDLLARLKPLAESRLNVLLLGENGTGKELVARVLHALGPRRAGPLVSINCGAIPAGLFESELFGHVRGAFTGADRNRAGKVEAAEGGTLFLDEVGDMPLELQPKLLRVLQERTYERVGENQTRKADIRVISATNRDLKSLVAAERFREDLYYRVSELPLRLPPLRERLSDIPDLATHFLREEGSRSPGLTPEAIEVLQKHPWPGNVRELRNVVLRASLFSVAGEPIGAEAIRAQIHEREPGAGDGGLRLKLEVPGDLPYHEAVSKLEADYLRQMLDRHPGITRAALAEKLGIARRTLFQRLRDLGLSAGRDEE